MNARKKLASLLHSPLGKKIDKLRMKLSFMIEKVREYNVMRLVLVDSDNPIAEGGQGKLIGCCFGVLITRPK